MLKGKWQNEAISRVEMFSWLKWPLYIHTFVVRTVHKPAVLLPTHCVILLFHLTICAGAALKHNLCKGTGKPALKHRWLYIQASSD